MSILLLLLYNNIKAAVFLEFYSVQLPCLNLVTTFISLTGTIELSCNVTADSTLTIYSYECSVTPGDGPLDTVLCSIDGGSMEPCTCSIISISSVV